MMAFLALLAASAANSSNDQSEKRYVRAVEFRYGNCVVGKNAGAAKRFVLNSDLKPGVFDALLQKVGDPDCLDRAADSLGGVEMRFPGDTMRYALANALVRKEFSRGAPLALQDAGPIEQPIFVEADYLPKPGKRASKAKELEEARARRIRDIFLTQFGECVVRADSAKSRQLLVTEPDSDEEGKIFSALSAPFSQCLTEGRSLTFNKTTLRGTIAINYYRLAHAPRQPATPSGAAR